MRIAVGHLIQETNAFSPVPTKLHDFRVFRDAKMVEQFRGTRTETGGFLDVLSSAYCEVVPILGADATTGGRLQHDDYFLIRSMIIDGIQRTLPVDGVLLALHGAMCAGGVDDVEGDLLSAIRQVIGPRIPLAITLDLHANITQAMVAQPQIIIGYKTWPHIDHYETGAAAAKLLLRTVRNEIHPITVMRKLPMILPAENMQTDSFPMANVFAAGENWRSENPEILSVSVFGVQPWMDVEEMGCTTLSVVERNSQVGQQCADSMATEFWRLRRSFDVHLLSPAEAIENALAIEGGPCVFGESSDSPSSGSTGDSVELLRELMAQAPNIFMAIWVCDPKAVSAAWQLGSGARICTQIGGTLDLRNHKPMMVDAIVERLSEGQFTYTGVFRRGLVEHMGRAAVLRAGRASILISENPVANIGVDLFRSQGIEPKEQKIIVVKSPGGFRPEYEPFAKGIFMVDTPGIASANLLTLPYTRIPRPVYPLDDLTSPFGS